MGSILVRWSIACGAFSRRLGKNVAQQRGAIAADADGLPDVPARIGGWSVVLISWLQRSAGTREAS